ncbi:helix-turn-helix transcriptional regulator [Nocardioides sp. cx-169]|uniref:helix-turn-helix domain-containing protein n=1 Tax=Nocardioides sp. cx-169 TaxID=2899080 RepID=UPI001E61A460|nr:helix-turn-helix transcriptional regulator [Nocardioides sp. cx-169]MCD4535683.1 helix-turn-helix transcriptional regulator [Nocardioides sp. cx-169]
MIATYWRLDMKLKSRDVLRQYMKFRGVNVRQLAEQSGVSRSTVGHLHSGKRKGCRPEAATAIEAALQAPPGLLFDAVVTNVSREVGVPA